MSVNTVRLSKFLSLVLRHRPDTIGIALDPHGWVSIDALVEKSRAAGTPFTRDELLHVVASNDKQRFTISDDGQRIRAAQGHSVSIDLRLVPREPPLRLYHGTATRFLDAILRDGLVPRSRQHVHLSDEEAMARRVGERHGTPVILAVDAARMHADGLAFYRSDNGVWLTDRVPPHYLQTL